MTRRSAPALIALGAAAVLGLAACTTGSDPGSDSDGTGSGSGALGECIIGSWSADVTDLGTQLMTYFTDNGTPVTAVESTGTLGLEVDATTMTYTSDVTHAMTARLSSGLDMVITQDQVGTSTGDWSVSGDSITFSDWNPGIEFETSVTIGGVDADLPIEVPADAGTGVPMATTCDGDVLTTKPDASPFTTTWARVG